MTQTTAAPRRAVQDVTAEITPELALDVIRLRELNRIEREAKQEKDAIRDRLDQALGSAYVGTLDGVPVVKRQDGTHTSFNARVLREGFPEAYEASVKVTDYHFHKGV